MMAAVYNAVNANTMVAGNVPLSKRNEIPFITGPTKPEKKKSGMAQVAAFFAGAPKM